MASLHTYYKRLALEPGASIDEIKKAYRKCARSCHPDLNKEEGAAERFIEVTEAYEILLSWTKSSVCRAKQQQEAHDQWIRYRQEQARRRAYAYSRVKYTHFKKTRVYKSSKALDLVNILFNLAVSVMIILFAIYGYIWKLQKVSEGFDKPTLGGFIFLVSIGLIFLTISLTFLKVFMINKKRPDLNEPKTH